ncbi:MAG: hypothetical protein ABI906_01445 [Pseudomonadota bacterium]
MTNYISDHEVAKMKVGSEFAGYFSSYPVKPVIIWESQIEEPFGNGEALLLFGELYVKLSVDRFDVSAIVSRSSNANAGVFIYDILKTLDVISVTFREGFSMEEMATYFKEELAGISLLLATTSGISKVKHVGEVANRDWMDSVRARSAANRRIKEQAIRKQE